MMCGGSFTSDLQKDCYQLLDGGNWTRAPSMQVKRMVDGGLQEDNMVVGSDNLIRMQVLEFREKN